VLESVRVVVIEKSKSMAHICITNIYYSLRKEKREYDNSKKRVKNSCKFYSEKKRRDFGMKKLWRS
jgi:hypothetical protein